MRLWICHFVWIFQIFSSDYDLFTDQNDLNTNKFFLSPCYLNRNNYFLRHVVWAIMRRKLFCIDLNINLSQCHVIFICYSFMHFLWIMLLVHLYVDYWCLLCLQMTPVFYLPFIMSACTSYRLWIWHQVFVSYAM